jgi:FkbM family methyltransferase
MKSFIKKFLQTLLGFDTYLFLFSIFTIKTLRWNKNEGDFLHFLSIIPHHGTILDIGANIGIMTVHLGRRFPSKVIHAFEPMPDNLKALRRIIRYFHLNNVRIHEYALGDKPGELEMIMPVVDHVKMQGLSHMVHESIDTFNDGEKEMVQVKTLDEIEPEISKSGEITAIKMDVENFEYFVLLGAKEMIKKHKPIIYTELWENKNRKMCFDFILNMNYSIRVIENKKLVDFDEGRHKTQNFFFIPD